MVALMEHFRNEGTGRESEWARQRLWFIKARHDHQRREDLADRAEETASVLAGAVAIVATPVQIKTFQSELDTFDVSIIDALIEIDAQLDTLYAKREALLSEAYVIVDGRRVFKSDDGTYIVDEHGEIVDPHEVMPEQIPDHLARYSEIADVNNVIAVLETEKQSLHDALDRNEAARDWAEEPGRTVEELEAKRQELLDDLPATARAKLDINTEPRQDVGQVAQSAPIVPSDIPTVAVGSSLTKFEM